MKKLKFLKIPGYSFAIKTEWLSLTKKLFHYKQCKKRPKKRTLIPTIISSDSCDIEIWRIVEAIWRGADNAWNVKQWRAVYSLFSGISPKKMFIVSSISWHSHFFTRKKICFFINCKSFFIKTGCSLIVFDVIFPMQSSEFTKSLKFGSISRKKNA